MKNDTNLYDIDGNLIRAVDDTHKMTLKEAQEKIEEYRNKLKELDEKDPKAVIYATYMRNLAQYIMTLYAKMPAEQLNAILEENKAKALGDQVKDAIEQLKSDVEEPISTEDSPVTQDDLLVERNETETVMDEYVNEIEPVEPEVLES